MKPKAADDAAEVAWFGVDELPILAFDHPEIIATARRRLRNRFDEDANAFGFLPESFTLHEFQKVVEIIQGEPLDSRRFRRRVLALELVEETGKTRAGDRRPARLYRARRRDSR